ncbi:MAG: hypothetical protein ACE5EL_08775 [Anaerolineae bacterium]
MGRAMAVKFAEAGADVAILATFAGIAVLVALRGADLAVLGRPRGRW